MAGASVASIVGKLVTGLDVVAIGVVVVVVDVVVVVVEIVAGVVGTLLLAGIPNAGTLVGPRVECTPWLLPPLTGVLGLPVADTGGGGGGGLGILVGGEACCCCW